MKRRSQDADERAAKLMSFGKSSHVSARGIKGLMEQIEEDGLPESFSRASQFRAKRNMCGTATPYGTLVKNVDVIGTFRSGTSVPKQKSFTIAFQNPFAFLHLACLQSQHYSMIMQKALDENPPSPSNPWTIILYSDGVDPTDTASKTHTRKFIIFYWTFMELGMAALAHEEVWGILTAVRESHAKALEGGITGLTSMCLDQFHGAEFDIMRAGVAVNFLNGGRAKMFAKVGVMLADEPAFKDMLDCKGHGGTKCCFLCQNCVLHKAPQGSIPLHLFSEYTVSIAEPDFKKFHMHSDQSLRDVITKLNEYKLVLNDKDFEIRSQMLGFNWNPKSIICNPTFQLQCVSFTMFDWAHTYICDGLADAEFGAFMQVMCRNKSSGTTYAGLAEYVEGFRVPKCRRSLARLFDGARYKNYVATGKFPATASEFLTLAPILRRYLRRVVQPLGCNPKHVESMVAVMDVVDMLQATKHRDCVQPSSLYRAIAMHFRLFIAAYGANDVRPKHHYALHLPLMLKQFGVLVTTLVHERRHKLAKKYARNRDATVQFERGLVEDVTCHQLWELGQPFFQTGSSAQPKGQIMKALRDMFPCSAGFDITLHDNIAVNGGVAKHGDVVSFAFEGHQCVGSLCLTIGVAPCDHESPDHHDLVSIVRMWEPVEPTTDVECRSFRVTDHQVKIQTQSLGTVYTYWRSECKSACAILVPYELRNRDARAAS